MKKLKRHGFGVVALMAVALMFTLTFSGSSQALGVAPEKKPSAKAAGARDSGAGAASARPKASSARPEGSSMRAESSGSSSRLVGTWPSKTPKVSVNVRKGTVAQALRSIAKQAGWGLMLGAPTALTERQLTLQVRNRPAAEVLDLVLMHGRLKAELKNKVLVVTPFTGAAGAKKGRWKSFDDAQPGADKAKGPGGEAKGGVTPGRVGGPDAKGAGTDVKDEPGAADGDDRRRKRDEDYRRSRRDRVVVGQSLRIKKGEEVDAAVAIGGSVTVLGIVHSEAVAIGGSVIVEPGGVVKGDAVALGGKIEVKEGAKLHGDRVAIGGSLKNVITFVSGLATGSVGWFMYSVVGTIVRSLILLLLALMVLTFMAKREESIRGYMAEKPGASILGGIGLAIGFIPLCVLLAITIVGLIMIPFAILALLVVHVIGLTVFMTWLGYKIPLFESGKSPIVAMLMGLVVVTLVDLIPVVGSIAVAGIAFISAGAVLLSQVGKPADTKPEPEQPAEAAAA